ncbi:MAG: ribonucleoside-diphosphate reductase, adenosylcobalamin-dependent, partial [Parcubacteria group bacterium]|nr:ribonucleoside-diphosphate reductase, adenosylcobalamin-dependent [Parcubacteria group bacterium]
MLDGLRLKVFNDRYALKDSEGSQLESAPEEMWKRVADVVAGVEETDELKKEWGENFFNALKDFKFVPAGRILSGAGSGASVTFYNCFVIPSPEDSRGGIMDSVKTMTEIMSRG